MIQSEHSIRFTHGNRGKRQLRSTKQSQKTPGRIPRVTKLMALAIRLDQLIRDGVVADQAELARLGYVSRARITQIMNLLQLAPDIQEEILMLPRSLESRDVVSEHELRQVAAETSWAEQRRIWAIVKRTRLRSTLRQRDR
jgi:hypothetical protein